jgi:hypothetical protein
MEASLSPLSLQESATASLTSLPPELLLDIASHLPLGSLARSSLASRSSRASSGMLQPKLHRKVELSCDGATEGNPRRKESIKTTLKLLAQDSARCGLILGLDLRDWGWMEEVELRNFEMIVRGAPKFKALQLVSGRPSPADRSARA